MYRQDEPEVNLEQILDRLRSFFGSLGFRGGGGGGSASRLLPVLIGIIVVVAVVWLGTGFYRVEAGEQGVVRQFGKFDSISEPGLNWRLPSPITSLVKVNISIIRIATIGFGTTERGVVTRDLDEALMLTTDNSIVEAQMVLQYRISDPRAFVFNVKDPELVLHTTAEVALRSIVGRTEFTDATTGGRALVELDTREFLENLLITYETGIRITDLKLQTVDPPDEVKDAFQEVTRALEDETRLENEALAYRADQVPRALGQVQIKIQSAAAFHRQQTEKARGEATRFLSLLQEYRAAPKVTRERLYLETLEVVLGTVGKTLIDSEVDVFPFLNIQSSGGLQETIVGPEQGR